MTHKKPQTSSAQPTVDPPHGGHVGMPVEQFHLATGRTIARFDSYNDAERATGIDRGGISACVRGEQKSAGGFGWRKPGSGETAAAAAAAATATASGKGATSKKPQTSTSQSNVKKPHTGGTQPQAVEQYDRTTGRTIAQFDSQRDAERATGISQGSISSCIRGKMDDAGGYGWRRPGTGGAAGAATGSHFSRLALSKPSTGTYYTYSDYLTLTLILNQS